MKRVAYKRPDGGVSIVIPVIFDGETEEEAVQRVRERDLPADAADVQDLDDLAIPSDRTFRNAWRLDPGRVEVDMPAARDLHMARIRAARDHRLRELDTKEIEAWSKSDQKTLNQIGNEKQTLRDLPQNTDLSTATTPEELKSIWPQEL